MPDPKTQAELDLASGAELCMFGGAPDGHTIKIDYFVREALRRLIVFAYQQGRADTAVLLSTPSRN